MSRACRSATPKFRPLFRRMAEHDLPVWVHPMRGPDFADYATEKTSQDEVWFSFGWPYETTACMTRLIYSGLFDELPHIKIISHHMGGMIPYFPAKINLGFRQIFFGTRDENPVAKERGLKKPPLTYYKMLYADTALGGEDGADALRPRLLRHAELPVCHRRAVRFRTGPLADRRHHSRRRSGSTFRTRTATRIFSGNARALLKL